MRKTLLTLILLLAFCSNGFSQNLADNNWAFGDSCGLNFSTGEPEFFTTKVCSLECVASISDKDGNLAFYTNGEKIWNSKNEVMPNGDSLYIGSGIPNYGSSITQGGLIIPQPQSLNLYYVFHLTSTYPYGLYYSIVDMDLDDGFGDVIEKNTFLYNHTLTEKMQAVKHGNGSDFWLLVHEYPDPAIPDNSNVFTRFLIANDGISGPYFQEDTVVAKVGQIKFSKDGSKLAVTNSTEISIYDFDRCEGTVSNKIIIHDVSDQSTYSCEFSADGRMLYVSDASTSSFNSKIYQYCLDCAEIIDSTKLVIYKNIYDDFWISGLQLAPDDKIYLSTGAYINPNYDFVEANMSLSIINYPNESGASCDTSTIWLNGNRTKYALPNMPNYNLSALIGSDCDTITAINNNVPAKDNIEIYPNPANTIINISSHLANYQTAIASIYTIAGNKVREVNLTGSLQKIDVTGLQQGLYTVVIGNENGYLYSEKFVIIK